jgi:hypothetical protein
VSAQESTKAVASRVSHTTIDMGQERTLYATASQRPIIPRGKRSLAPLQAQPVMAVIGPDFPPHAGTRVNMLLRER